MQKYIKEKLSKAEQKSDYYDMKYNENLKLVNSLNVNMIKVEFTKGSSRRDTKGHEAFCLLIWTIIIILCSIILIWTIIIIILCIFVNLDNYNNTLFYYSNLFPI